MVPLNFKILQTDLGPGYRVGFYGWSELEGRIKNCKITDLDNLQRNYATVMSLMNETFEEWAVAFDEFHGEGHVSIGTACSPLNGEGGMWYTSLSQGSHLLPVAPIFGKHCSGLQKQELCKVMPYIILHTMILLYHV